MKQTISLDSEIYTATSQVSPRFSALSSQPPSSVEFRETTPLVDIDFPLFEEATQTAARFLGIPISFVGWWLRML